jgi:hypothetical protein
MLVWIAFFVDVGIRCLRDIYIPQATSSDVVVMNNLIFCI